MHLTEIEIANAIKEYIASNSDQAIMLDGKWGSGKTYFVKNDLRKLIKSEYQDIKFVYVSLYGVSTSNEILKRVYESYADETLTKGAGKKLNNLIKFGSVFAGKINIDLKKVPAIDEFIKIKNSILIFDDVERAKIDLVELFGHINTYVEHKNIKTLLVAYDNEIKLKVDSENDDKEASISKYKVIKEKLISNTIIYNPDIKEKYKQIIETEYSSSQIKDCLIRNENNLIETMNNINCYNLRTLKFALSAFDRFGTILRKNIKEELYKDRLETELNLILLDTIKNAARLKGDCPDEPTLDTQDSLNIRFPYWFVRQYLSDYYLNEKEIVTHISSKILNSINSQQKDSIENGLAFNHLKTWRRYEDDQIQELVDRLLRELRENRYSTNDYPFILIILLSIRENDLAQLNLNEYINLIVENSVQSSEELMLQFYRMTLAEVEDEYKEIVNNYKSYSNQIIKKIRDRMIPPVDLNDIICKGLYELEKVCVSNSADFSEISGFMRFIDVNNFIEEVKRATLANIIDLRTSFEMVYVNGREKNFTKDIESLKIFYNELEKIPKPDDRKNYTHALKALMHDIELIIVRLKIQLKHPEGDENLEL